MLFRFNFFLDRENRMQFLNDIIKNRFIQKEGKFVTETDILHYIGHELWRNGKVTVHGEVKTDLIECFQHLYPGTQRRKKGKKGYPLYFVHLSRLWGEIISHN